MAPRSPAHSPHSPSDSKSTLQKSYNGDASRSSSQALAVDELQEPERAVSFDSRFTLQNERDDSPANSTSPCRLPHEIETPHGPIRRDGMNSLASLAPHASPEEQLSKTASTWPTDPKAWLCLAGGFLLMFNSWGIVNTYGTYSSYYTQTLFDGSDILLMNLVGSTQSFMVLLLSAPVGRFLDGGYSRHLIVIGTVLVSLGSFLLGSVNGEGKLGQGNYGLTWLTQGFITGLGMACFFVTSSQVVATWFQAKKGFAIGIVASGASISGLIYPIMTAYLIDSHGFNNAVRFVATVICGTSILAIIVTQPNPQHIVRKPETWCQVKIFWDKHAFKNRSFAFMVASISLLFLGFYAVFFNLEEWAISEGFGFRHLSDDGANSGVISEPAEGQIRTMWLLAMMNGASTIGRLSSSYLCDYIGALNVHCMVTFIASILTMVLWSLANNLSQAIAFVIVFGAFSGAVIGLPPASVAYILGPCPQAQSKLGQWTGMMYSTAAIPALAGPIIAGHLISEYKTFLAAQLWAGACMFLSATCMACSIYCKHKAERSVMTASKMSETNSPPPETEDSLSEKEDV